MHRSAYCVGLSAFTPGAAVRSFLAILGDALVDSGVIFGGRIGKGFVLMCTTDALWVRASQCLTDPKGV